MEKTIKEQLEELEDCSCMACTLCEHRSYLEKQNKGCGREWTESACVKTEPDYCGEGDNLCPECEEKENKPLSEKKRTQLQRTIGNIILNTGITSFEKYERIEEAYKQAVKEAYLEIGIKMNSNFLFGKFAGIIMGIIYQVFKDKFGFVDGTIE